jgi:hypothetical protein
VTGGFAKPRDKPCGAGLRAFIAADFLAVSLFSLEVSGFWKKVTRMKM